MLISDDLGIQPFDVQTRINLLDVIADAVLDRIVHQALIISPFCIQRSVTT